MPIVMKVIALDLARRRILDERVKRLAVKSPLLRAVGTGDEGLNAPLNSAQFELQSWRSRAVNAEKVVATNQKWHEEYDDK
jgi:hypothetical protein